MKKGIFLKTLVAACLVAVIGVLLWLFVPLNTYEPDMSKYASSSYYPLIQKIGAYTYKAPTYKNNFEKLTAAIGNSGNDDIGYDNSGAAPGLGGNTTIGKPEISDDVDSDYTEVTDNQVQGVIEADRIKRSSTHIYHIYENTLNIYSIEGENSVCLSSFEYANPGLIYFSNVTEFYLSDDCKNVTIIVTGSAIKSSAARTAIISVDVSDPTKPVEKGSILLNGNYITSRMVNGSLLVMNSYYFGSVDYENHETFVPYIETADEKQFLAMENIVLPEKLTSSNYTTVTELSAETLELVDSAAFYSYSSDFYVSPSTIYALRPFSDMQVISDRETRYESKTDISVINYGAEGFELSGTLTVPGSVRNQYSVDEFEGVLRVFTTLSKNSVYTYYDYSDETIVFDGGSTSGASGSSSAGSSSSAEPGVSSISGSGTSSGNSSSGSSGSVSAQLSNRTNAGFYAYDLASMSLISSVEYFAPEGESVTSARFSGKTAYVCTSIELSDPVFFFDLSDYSNITYKESETITGFSSSLINLGDVLLGIGREGWTDLKLELYEETETGVESIDSFVKKNTSYPTDYKCYYVNREEGFIGIPVYGDWTYNSPNQYLLFKVNDGKLELVASPTIECYYLDMARGVVIDDYLYVLGKTLKVVKVNFN